MSDNYLTPEEAAALQRLLKRLDHEDALKFVMHPKPDGDESLCEKCGFPMHPCMPCEEVVAFYNHVDEEYFRLINLILENGKVKKNRTGVDTIGVFGAQAKFEVDMEAFPILTTKKVWFKGIVHELLWFIKGDTNIKYLVDNDVHIWDEWAYARYKKKKIFELEKDEYFHGKGNPHSIHGQEVRLFTQDEFIEKIKTNEDFAEKWGELGEGTYGGMWRDFPAHVKTNGGTVLGVDQIHTVINKLQNNPDDRRMIVSAWHPYWVDHCALPPCHCMFHFNTEELTQEERLAIFEKGWDMKKALAEWHQDKIDVDKALDEHCIPRRKLNLLLYQRSCDTFLGVPFNITSYSLLLAMVAHCVGMEPGTFTHTYGDLHIYQNHREQIDVQLKRSHKKLPKLWLNPKVKNLFDFKFEDIKLEGYDPHPAIKGEVAV